MSTDSDRWKNKYLNLIDENEKLEQSFEDSIGQLRRAIIRLSITAEGRDADMDSQLESIRDLLRTDQLSGLSRILEQIESGFERWQARQESFQGQITQTLIDIETTHQLPKQLMGELTKVRKQVRQTDKVDLLLAFTSVIAQWAEALANTGSTQDMSQTSGFFSRLFNKEQSTPIVDRDDTHDNNDDESSYHIPEAAEKGLLSITSETSKVLESLIPKLTLPNTEQPRAIHLLGKVQEGLNLYEIVPALEVLAELVISALGTEQEEFDTFLKSLNERLSELQNWLSQGQSLEQGFKSASKDFDDKMRGHLDDLKQVLKEGTDSPQNLKGSVSQQLDRVFATLDIFKHEQQNREKTFEQHINELSDRLMKMEGELETAKTQLNKSQAKAMVDSLTKLPNRGAYDAYIVKEHQRFVRYGGELSLIVCDVDKFKNINDSYGHQAGDKVLQLISRQVKKGTRQTDLLARYGGEEFVVILPNTDIKSAYQVSEKIRQQVENCPFHFKGERVQITLSCGVASFSEGMTHEQVFERADKALYQAKENGRNKSVIGD
ncbi:GGDEF domain-containing protein [Pseudomonas sp. HK3]